MFENLGGAELMLVFIIILIFFGPKKIPELASSFGKGLRKFREAKAGMEEQFRTAIKEPLTTMKEAQKNFNTELNAAQKGFEKKVKEAMSEETDAMRQSGEAVKKQIEEAARSFETFQQSNPPQIPSASSPPEVHTTSTGVKIYESVPGGVKIHKLI